MSKADQAKELDIFEKMGYAFTKIDESWEALKFNILTFIGIIAVPVIATIVALPIMMIPFFASVNSINEVVSISLIPFFLVTLVLVFIYLLVTPAIVVTQLASVNRQKISVTEAFSQSKNFIVRYILIYLLIGLAIAIPFVISSILVFVLIGFILLPVAFVWAIMVYFFTLIVPYVLISKDLSVTNSIKYSYELTKKNWQWILALIVVYIGVQAVSIVPFIGWVAAPVLAIAYACLPAYIYIKHIDDSAPVKSKDQELTVAKKNKKASKPSKPIK